MSVIHVTCWNEFRHEKTVAETAKIYPEGIHAAIAAHLNGQKGIEARLASLDEPEHGLTREVLDATDVLTWWGHMAHEEVADEVVERVCGRVLDGMGLIVLHSGHYSKVFRKLMGTGCRLAWREADEKERLWVVDPSHPITQGVGRFIELPQCEMYGEVFDVPYPEQLLFVSWYEGGNVFRSGMTWHRGRGKVFYFRPGHEAFPVYRNEQVIRVLANAVRWAAPTPNMDVSGVGETLHEKEPLEVISKK